MLEIKKHGIQYIKPIRKFKCSRCYCKFTTDEYRYTYRLSKKGAVLVVACPECNEDLYRYI